MIKTIFVMFLAVPLAASAGWFGPDNYEECIVAKMKGQDKSMLSVVESACRSKFPRPIHLAKYAGWGDDKEIKIAWEGKYVRVIRNDTPYIITEIILVFSRKSCNQVRSYSDFSSPFINFKVKGSVGTPEKGFNPSLYECAMIENVLGVSR